MLELWSSLKLRLRLGLRFCTWMALMGSAAAVKGVPGTMNGLGISPPAHSAWHTLSKGSGLGLGLESELGLGLGSR